MERFMERLLFLASGMMAASAIRRNMQDFTRQPEIL
jgi:hypothetical protein